MDIAVVTGGNIGIGLAISKKLITLGFRVHAIADDFSKTPFAHKDFIPTSVPDNDTEALTQAAKNISENTDNLCIFVNAQVRKPHLAIDTIPLENLQSQFNQYLLHPLLLTRLFIDKLRHFQGFIININYENPYNSLSASIEGGLSSFYAALFEEYRQQGVNVTQLILQSIDDSNPINGDMIANTIDHLIRFKGGNTVTKIMIRPQDAQALTKIPQITPSVDEFREIQLPTKNNFPKHQKPIETLAPVSRRKSSLPKLQKSQKPPFQEKTPKIQETKTKPQETTTPPITTITSTPKISRDSIVIPHKPKQQSPTITPISEDLKEPEKVKKKPNPKLKNPNPKNFKLKKQTSDDQIKDQSPTIEFTEQKNPESKTAETPKVTRDTVIIPREKKKQKLEDSPITSPTIEPKINLESKPDSNPQATITTAKPNLRIRRGRPSTKQES